MAGQIKADTPELVTQQAVMVEKIANIAIPNTSNTVFDKMANAAPAPVETRMSPGYQLAPTTVGTSKFQTLASKMADNSRYQLKLPNLAGKPKSGIGSAMQEVEGGKGAGTSKGNTVFVDDKNWPVTLKEILGSRLLTTEQLQKYSIDNVKKMFTTGLNSGRHQGSASVGTKEQNEELYYMMQRMMIEGAIRGVDMTDAIKKRGGLNIAIRNVSFNENAKNNLGLHSTGKGGSSINFKASAWNKMNEAEKYTLFMHEVGHGLLWQPEKDKDVYGIMGDGPYGVSKKLMSSKQEYNRLLDHHFSTRGNKGVTAIARTSPGKGTDQFDPSWFPQLSGEQVKIDGGNYSPGTGGDAGSPDMPNYDDEFKNISSLIGQMSASNDAMKAAMDASFAAQQEQMNQSMRLNAVNTMQMSNTQPGQGIGAGNAAGAAAQGGTLAAGTLGMPDTQAIFAAGIANLESSSNDAGGVLASG